ncbi:MAG TPA: type II secretion system protein N [Steroidobacteraceae bacterium]|nr:type II secretion system protein N [Steroidobacteraceae bacterium]HRX91001.1 type II secretion system protein N [Steroidobacteraceae bacterium]
MKRVGLTVAASLAVFVFVLLFNLPANWIRRWLPTSVGCGDLAGTVWRGECAAFSIGGGPPLGTLAWNISPWRIVIARAVGTVSLAGRDLAASASLALRFSGDGEISNLRLRLPLDPAIVSAVPANIRGVASADIRRLELRNGKLAALTGVVETSELRDVGSAAMPLGDYAVTFDGDVAADGSLTGELVDRGGPLSVRATLQLTPEPGYLLRGVVSARAEAAAHLQRQLEMLGPPDGNGQRQFALEGTF